jgi:hypothetical protein
MGPVYFTCPFRRAKNVEDNRREEERLERLKTAEAEAKREDEIAALMSLLGFVDKPDIDD